jgi:hypothetical protein
MVGRLAQDSARDEQKDDQRANRAQKRRGVGAMADGIASSGISGEMANDLASYVLASLEGAIILSRTSRSVRPLEQAAQFVLDTIKGKLPRPPQGKGPFHIPQDRLTLTSAQPRQTGAPSALAPGSV